jgi:hypothetical protein
VDRDIQDLEKQKRVLELKNQIEQLKVSIPSDNGRQTTTPQEINQIVKSRDSVYQLMQIAFGGSGAVSILIIFVLLWKLLRNPSYLSEKSDSPEATLKTYLHQALSELRWYSGMSLAAMVIGVSIIFSGVLLALTDFTTIGLASSAAGIVTEAVSYLFHKQTDKVRAEVAKIRQHLLNLQLAGTIDDKTIKDKAKDRILNAGLNPQLLSPDMDVDMS